MSLSHECKNMYFTPSTEITQTSMNPTQISEPC